MEKQKGSPKGFELSPGDGGAAGPTLRNFRRYQFATPEEAAAAAEEIGRLETVESARRVPLASPANLPRPNDPLISTLAQGNKKVPGQHYTGQWYLHRTGVLQAWDLGARGEGVVVADVDFGCLSSHEDLQTQLEYTYWNNLPDVSTGPEVYHGTAVLGIVGAAANGKGICGYAPSARLWMIRGDEPPPPSTPGSPGEDSWANAILHACNRESGGRPKVILVEVQTRDKCRNFEQVSSVAKAIRWAIDHHVVVVVAAGNGDAPAHLDDDDSPIEETGSILVGATGWHDTLNPRATDSNFGPRIVVSAPGDWDKDVTCDYTADDDYRDGFGGTSGAAAKVAGTAALMLSMNPDLKHADVRDILVASGTPIPPDPQAPEKTLGKFLNTAAAVEEAIRRRVTGPEPTPENLVDEPEPEELDEAA